MGESSTKVLVSIVLLLYFTNHRTIMADGRNFFEDLKNIVMAQTEDGIPKSIDKLTALYVGQRTAEETTTPNPKDLIDSVKPHIHEMRSYLSDVRMLVSHHLVK